MEQLKELWAKMSSREKIALGVVVAGVVGYALYKRSKASSASSPGANVGQNVDAYGNPLYPTNLAGVYSTQPGGNFNSGGSGSGSTGTTTIGTTSSNVIGSNLIPPPNRRQQYATIPAGDSIAQAFQSFGVNYQNVQNLPGNQWISQNGYLLNQPGNATGEVIQLY